MPSFYNKVSLFAVIAGGCLFPVFFVHAKIVSEPLSNPIDIIIAETKDFGGVFAGRIHSAGISIGASVGIGTYATFENSKIVFETAIDSAKDLTEIFAEGFTVAGTSIAKGVEISFESYGNMYDGLVRESSQIGNMMNAKSLQLAAVSETTSWTWNSFWCWVKGVFGFDCAPTVSNIALQEGMKTTPEKLPATQKTVVPPTPVVVANETPAPTITIQTAKPGINPSSSPSAPSSQVLSFSSIVASLKNIFAPISSLDSLKARVGILEKTPSGGASQSDILALQKQVDAIRSSNYFSPALSYTPTAMIGANGQAVTFNSSAPNGIFENSVSAQTGAFSGGVTGGSFNTAGTLTVGGASAFTGDITAGNITATGSFTAATSTFSGSLTAGNTLYIDAANGRVGIGTSTPTDTFSVNGPIYFAPITPSATVGRLYNNGGDLYWAGSLLGGATTGNWTTDGTNAWRATGNVGIGTTSPYAKLSVVGQIVGEYFTATSTTATSTLNGGLSVAGVAGLTVLQNGNTGIGTATPSYKLDVNGFINTDLNSGYKQDGYTILATDSIARNFFVGYGAGTAGVNSAGNNFMGKNAGSLCINCTTSVAIGDYAMSATLGYPGGEVITEHASTTNNVVIGALAMSATTGYPQHAVAIGYNSQSVVGDTKYNTSIGYQSMEMTAAGDSNVAIGAKSLRYGTGESYNTAIGWLALTNASGNDNSCVGAYCLQSVTSGIRNSAVGFLAGSSVTTGSWNTLLGYQTGVGITTGQKNIYLGAHTVWGNANITTGSNNIIIGNDVQAPSATGDNQLNIGNLIFGTNLSGTGATVSSGNIGIGTTTPYARLSVAGETVASNFTATSTTATSTFSGGLSALADMNIGSNSRWYQNGQSFMTSSTTAAGNLTFGYQTPGNINASGGLYNSYFGYQAGQSATSSSYNTGIGYQALKSVVNSGTTLGNLNTAVGYRALYSNTTGYGNTANGVYALQSNTTGYANIANGYQALYLNTTGYYNIANGISTLRSNTTGAYNIGNGVNALFFNTTGNYNIANGSNTLYSNTTGSSNTANGISALYSNTTGANNVALGFNAGYGSGTLADNRSVIDTYMTFLGVQASRDAAVASTTILTNGTAIGKNAQVGCSNCLVLGGTGADGVNVGIGTTTPYAKLSVVGQVVGEYFTATSTTATSTFSGGLSALADMNIGSNSRWYQNGQSFMTSSTTAAGNLTFGYQTPGNINASGGLYNSYFGYQAGQSATSSVRNTGLGYQALKSVASGEGVSKGNDNTAIGYVALSNNTYGYQNTAIGSRALLVNTTGYQNVALGFNALSSNTSGYNNFGIGHYSLAAVTTGTGNVAIGVSALRATTASNNVGIGASALQSNTSGYQNTSIGATALYLNTTGYNVTGVGDHAMMYSTGINNTGFGQSVGMWLDNNLAQYRITTDTNMTLLGHNATKDNASQLDNGIAIGADARVLASNQAVFGNDNITTTLLKGKVGIGTTTPAWLLDIATTSAPQLALTDPNAGANLKHWTFRSSGGSLFFATSTDAYTTSSIAALTINSNGYIGVATTSPWRAFSVNGAVAMIGLSASQGNAVCIDANGEITNPGASACTGSSERFKEKIETLAPGFALDELSKLRVVSFDYKEGNYSAEDQKGSYGMIAEEVALVDDKLVDYGYDRQPLTLKFEKFIGLFVQAIQDLVARITGLEDKFAEQQAEIEALKARMNTLDGQTAAAITGEPLHCASPKVLSDDGKSCINAPVEKTLSCTSPDVPNADGTSCVAPELKCADDEVPTDGKCVKTAPVIALVGEPSISWSLNVKYADPGAVAKDYSGAEISPVIINSAAVDIATAGSYAVTYNITDSAGHKAAEVTRTVIVTAE